MADFSFDNIITLLPLLRNNPTSIELFINKGDLIFSTLTKPESKAFFLKFVKSSIIENLKIKINDLKDWNQIKNVLISNIMPYKSTLRLLEDLLKIKQFSNETIQKYYLRIYKVTNDLNMAYKLSNPTANSSNLDFLYSLNEKTALQVFIRGIKSLNLRIWLKSRNFNDFNQAFLFAKENESDASTEDLIPNSKTKLNKPTFNCTLCFRTGHQSKFCRIPKQNTQKTNSISSSQPINPNPGINKPIQRVIPINEKLMNQDLYLKQHDTHNPNGVVQNQRFNYSDNILNNPTFTRNQF